MALDLSNTLVVGISSSALFDLAQEDEIFRTQGLQAFLDYQREQESVVLSRGTAFPLVRALLELNNQSTKSGTRRVEVVLMSRNHPEVVHRVFHSIENHNLDISRAALTGGSPVAPYMGSFKVDLFLSANQDDVQDAMHNGVAAGLIWSVPENCSETIDHVRIAFDADCVLFSEESQNIMDKQGLDAFHAHERTKARDPLPPGPFEKLVKTIARMQGDDPTESPFRLALVTARNAPAHERPLRTLSSWGVRMDQAFFMGGLPKTEVLEQFQPHIFFDDQEENCAAAASRVPTAQVSRQRQVSLPLDPSEAIRVSIDGARGKADFVLVCKTYLKKEFDEAQTELEEWYAQHLEEGAVDVRTNIINELSTSVAGTPVGEARRSVGKTDNRTTKLKQFLANIVDKYGL